MKLHPWPLERADAEFRVVDAETIAALSEGSRMSGDGGNPFTEPAYVLRIHGRFPEGTCAALYVGNEAEIAFAAMGIDGTWLVTRPVRTPKFVELLVDAVVGGDAPQLDPQYVRGPRAHIAALWGRGGTPEFDALLDDAGQLDDWREVLGSSEAVEVAIRPVPRIEGDAWLHLRLIGPRGRRVSVLTALDDPTAVVLTQLSPAVVRSVLEAALLGRDADFSAARAGWTAAAEAAGVT